MAHHPGPPVRRTDTDPVGNALDLPNGRVICTNPAELSGTVDQLESFYQQKPEGMVGTPVAGLGKKIALTAWTGDPAKYYRNHNYGMGHLAVCSSFDQKAFAGELRAGDNLVLVKVAHNYGRLGFSLRLANAKDVPLVVTVPEEGVEKGLMRFSIRIGAEPRNARLTKVDGHFKTFPPRPGKELDPAAVAKALQAARGLQAMRSR